MITVYALHEADPDRLEEVKAEMVTLGAPKIDVVDCGDFLMALEGSHRLFAAEELGLTPEFNIFDQDDELDVTSYDWFDGATWVEQDVSYTAGEVAGNLLSVNSPRCRF